MKNSKRLRWALLLLMPIIMFAVMWPIARERRKGPLTQELILAPFNGRSINQMQELISQGADVNGKLRDRALGVASEKGDTALHFCAQNGNEEARKQIQFLLKNGADVNAQNDNGETPLMRAAQYGYYDTVKILIDAGAQVNLKTRPLRDINNGNNPFLKRRTALSIAEDYAKTKNAKSSGLLPQMKETIKVLKAAGAKE